MIFFLKLLIMKITAILSTLNAKFPLKICVGILECTWMQPFIVILELDKKHIIAWLFHPDCVWWRSFVYNSFARVSKINVSLIYSCLHATCRPVSIFLHHLLEPLITEIGFHLLLVWGFDFWQNVCSGIMWDLIWAVTQKFFFWQSLPW